MLVLLLELVLLITCHADQSFHAEERSDHCYTQYVTVSVVKQVPSYSKHCTKVDDTKCKTLFKNAFTTQMETQCTPTFDTSCDTVLQTAYKQECKTIKDVECRIVNLEKYGKYSQKKICTEVPTQKCVPVPIKVEGQKCVNIPTQSCQTVPVVASVPVPKKQCFKKPRKVCQTLVTTKPKVVTEQIPKTVCGHDQPLKQKSHKTKKTTKSKQHRLDHGELIQGSINYPQKVLYDGGTNKNSEKYEDLDNEFYTNHQQHPQLSDEVPQLTYKKEDIPLLEEPTNFLDQNQKYDFSDEELHSGDYDNEIEPKRAKDFYEYENDVDLQANNLQNYYKNHNSQYYKKYLDKSEEAENIFNSQWSLHDENEYVEQKKTKDFKDYDLNLQTKALQNYYKDLNGQYYKKYFDKSEQDKNLKSQQSSSDKEAYEDFGKSISFHDFYENNSNEREVQSGSEAIPTFALKDFKIKDQYGNSFYEAAEENELMNDSFEKDF